MAYIDKEKLEQFFDRHEWGTCDERWRHESEFGKFVDAIPTADVVEVKHGKWSEQLLHKDEYGDKHVGYICSVCKEFVPHKGNYCLNCGAKMDGGSE